MKTLTENQCEMVIGGSFVRDLFYTAGYFLGGIEKIFSDTAALRNESITTALEAGVGLDAW